MDQLLSAEKPTDAFLSRDEATTKLCRTELARVYNAQANLHPGTPLPLGPLDILHVSDLFSFDQVWHQLETRNTALLPYAARRIESLVAAGTRSSNVGAITDDDDNSIDAPSSDEEAVNPEEPSQPNGHTAPQVNDDGSDSDDESPALRENGHPDGLRAAKPKRRVRFDLSPSENQQQYQKTQPQKKSAVPSRPGSLEDGFFSMADMEAFADDAELLAQQGKLIASDDESDDAIPDRALRRGLNRMGGEDDSAEEADDMDDEHEDTEDALDLDGADTKDKHKFLYSDFFDPPGASEAADAVRSARTRALLLDEIESDDEADTRGNDEEIRAGEVITDEASNAADYGEQTNLQKKRAKARKTIEAIEEANVSKRPWMLRGEVSASARPKDSLLDTELQHDIAVAPKSFTSSDVNEALEDVIKQRVADGLFDDVVMALPEEYAANKKKTKDELPEVSQDKPKESLAELYEREYNEDEERRKREMEASNTVQREEDAPETDEQVEVNKMWTKLAKKLDSLSSLHFQPTPQDEVEMAVKDNVKALSKEEAIPDAVSDGNLLAPKEVFTADKSDAKGEREVSKDERRAKRRRNKAKGKKSKVASKSVENAKLQADPLLADKRRAENALARRGKKLKTTSEPGAKKGVDASFAKAAFKARENVSKPDEVVGKSKESMSASQLRL